MVTKPCFVGDAFTRRPPKFERFIRPTGLRMRVANVTHPEMRATFQLLAGLGPRRERALWDAGVVDWALTKVPSWLGGGAHWAGFSWTNATLPAYTVLTVMLVWTGFPFVAVTVLAGLRTLPPALLEAARVDGAGPWRTFWKVTFPLLRPVFLVLALLSTIWDFGMFTQAYIVTGDLGNRDEYNLGLYEYSQAFTQPPHYGLASAAAFVLTIILLIVTVGYVRAAIKQGSLA